jgi:hypothetical protein
MKKFIIVLLFFSVLTESFNQNLDSLSFKYAAYRKRLNSIFLKVAWGTDGIGELKKDEDGNLIEPPFFEYSGTSFAATSFLKEKNEIQSGDGTIMHGHYIAMLATEYVLLKKQNDSNQASRTLEELYLSLQTIRRLDMLANVILEYSLDDLLKNKKIKSLEITKKSIQKDGYSGFFLRDDINWASNNYLESSWSTGFTGFQSDLDKSKDKAKAMFLKGNAPIVSQDQIYALIMGLGFVNNLLSESEVKEKPIRDLSMKISAAYLKSCFKNIKVPGTSFLVPRGNNNTPFRWQIRSIAKKWGLKDVVDTYGNQCIGKKINNYLLYGTGYNMMGVADDWTSYRKNKLLNCKGDYRDISNMKLRLECLDSDDPVTYFKFAIKNKKSIFGLMQEIMRPDFKENPTNFMSKRSKYQNYRNSTAMEILGMLQSAPISGPYFDGKNFNSKWNTDNFFANYEPKHCNQHDGTILMYNGIDFMLAYNILQLTSQDIIPKLKNVPSYSQYEEDASKSFKTQKEQIYEMQGYKSATPRSVEGFGLDGKFDGVMYDWAISGGQIEFEDNAHRKVFITPNSDVVTVKLKIERCDKWSQTGCIVRTLISEQTKVYKGTSKISKD